MAGGHLVLLIGLPGSGKSTLAQQWAEQQPRYRVVSTDAIRDRLFGDPAVQGSWLLVWQEVLAELTAVRQQVEAQQMQGAIYDATNVRRRERRKVLIAFRSLRFQRITGTWLDTPLEQCLARNQRRSRQVPSSIIEQMHRCLRGAPPSLEEGFDDLRHYHSAVPDAGQEPDW